MNLENISYEHIIKLVKHHAGSMGVTLTIKYCNQEYDVKDDQEQLEACQHRGTINLIKLNIFNETGGSIEYDDIRELFKELEQCNMNKLELNGMYRNAMKLLLGRHF